MRAHLDSPKLKPADSYTPARLQKLEELARRVPGPLGRILARQIKQERGRQVAEWHRLYPGCRCGYPVRGVWWTDSLHRPVHGAWLAYLRRSARSRRRQARHPSGIHRWADRALLSRRQAAATYWIHVLSEHRPDLLQRAGGPDGLRELVLRHGARHGTGVPLIERIKEVVDALTERGVLPRRRLLRHPPRWWLRTLRPPTWRSTRSLLRDLEARDAQAQHTEGS